MWFTVIYHYFTFIYSPIFSNLFAFPVLLYIERGKNLKKSASGSNMLLWCIEAFLLSFYGSNKKIQNYVYCIHLMGMIQITSFNKGDMESYYIKEVQSLWPQVMNKTE
jgi:hypothetical protein